MSRVGLVLRAYFTRPRATRARIRVIGVIVIVVAGTGLVKSRIDSWVDALGLLTGAGTVTAFVSREVWLYWQGDDSPATASAASLTDRLSQALQGQWLAEIHHRNLGVNPINVAWRIIPDRSGAAWRPSPAGVAPPEVPGVDTASVQARTSGLDAAVDLCDAFVALPHGRLVLLGGPGSGKTSILLLMLIRALEFRQVEDALLRSKIPVPVLLSLAEWRPAEVGIVEFAVETLARDIPALRTDPVDGPTLAEVIRTGGICFFLDGLDDMTEDRDLAIREINVESRVRIVLTSRPEEFAAVMRAQPLEKSAVVELLAVNDTVSREYLQAAGVGSEDAGGDDWDRVLRRLATLPTSTGLQLSTPLYLSLMVQLYRFDGPIELLDEARFSTGEEVAIHLIDRIVPRAYPRGPGHSAEQAKRWLTFIAKRMTREVGGTPLLRPRTELAWSYISELPPAWFTRTVYGSCIGLLMAAGSWLAATGSDSTDLPLGNMTRWVPLFWGTASALTYVLALVLDLRLTRQPVVGVAIGPAAGVGLGQLAGLLVALQLVKRAEPVDPGMSLLIGAALGQFMAIVFALLVVKVGLRSLRMQSRRQWPSSFGLGRPSWGTAGTLAGLCALFMALQRPSGAEATLVILSFLIAVGAESLLSAQATEKGASSARQSVRHDAAAWSALGVIIGVCGSLLLGGAFGTRPTNLAGWFVMLFAVSLLSSHTSGYLLAVAYFAAIKQLPLAPLRFLEEARKREVMRRNGWRYEFRHRVLLERLSHERQDPVRAPTRIDLRTVHLPDPLQPNPSAADPGTARTEESE